MSSLQAKDTLFTPLSLGNLTLSHRVILAPLTRYRAPNCVPGELMEEYYAQRTTPGCLLITEATSISSTCGVHPNSPRIDIPESIEGWKRIANAVHEKDGFLFMQLNHFGRSGIPKYNEGKLPLCSTAKKLSGAPISYPENDLEFVVPKPMDEDDMINVANDFADAAYNAIFIAGCDGVELHGANGYLLDEFLRDAPNDRTDGFGGSIENRCKFPLLVLDKVIAKIGESKKVGFRISPWDAFQEMNDSDPIGHFTYVCEQLEKRNLAYVHVIESRSDSNGGRENDDPQAESLNDQVQSSVVVFKDFLPTTPLISAGSWNDLNFKGVVQESGIDALAFGRSFLANPDLMIRLKEGYPLNKYDRSTFYTHLEPRGYIDYSFFK